MVHKKAKSKRGTARQKFKIIKNVAETHRKRRKEAKKSQHKVSKKDPGIPNNYPFKEELLHAVIAIKEQKELERQEKKKEKKELLDNVDLETFMESQPVYEKKVREKSHLLLKDIAFADVLIHVLDARDPQFGRALEIEDKTPIFILNKIDLIPQEAAIEWINVLKKDGQVIPFNSTNPAAESINLLSKALKKYDSVGVVGYPNSGKSTFIDVIKKSKDEELKEKIIPIPAIIFSETFVAQDSARVLVRNYSKSTLIPSPLISIEGIVSRFTKNQLCEALEIPFFLDTNDMLIHFARKRNYIRRGGNADTVNAARFIIQEWYDGKIPYFTTPSDTNNEPLSGDLKKIVDGLSMRKDMSQKVFKIKSYSAVPVKTDMEELPAGYTPGDLSAEACDDEEEFDDEDMESGDEVGDEEMDALLNINAANGSGDDDDEWEEVEE